MAIAVAVAEVFFERGFIVVDGVLERAVVIHRRHDGSGVGLQRQLEAALTGCENGEGRVVRGGEMTTCIRGQEQRAGYVATVRWKLQRRGSRVPAQLSRRDRIAWICVGADGFSFGQITQEGKSSGCGWLRKVGITLFPMVAGQTQVFCSMMQECGASGIVIAGMIALLRPMHEGLIGC